MARVPTAPPSRAFAQGPILATLTVLALVRVYVAWAMPITPDESYYWLWTRPLQLSYLDHPGMVAWWIWAGTALLGDTPLGIRAPAVLSGLVVTALLWDCGRRAFASSRAGAIAALWLNAMLLFNAAAVLMTPDAPMLLCWTTALWATVRLAESRRAGWLYLVALAGGLGFDSKYTIGLIVPGLAVAFLVCEPLRRWWKSPHLYLAAALALLATAPVFLWNAEHGWVSFRKQGAHAFAGSAAPGQVAEWLGSQVGLVTPLISAFAVVGMGWLLWQGWKRRVTEWLVIGLASAPVLVFFAINSVVDPVQAHWAGPAWLGGLLAVAGAAPALTRKPWARRCFRFAPVLGLVMTGLVFFQGVTALLPVPPRADPLSQLGGWDGLARAVEAQRAAHPGAAVAVIKHEDMGLLTFYMAGHPTVFLALGGTMPSNYDRAAVEALRGHDLLLVTRTRLGMPDGVKATFAGGVEDLGGVPLTWGGRPTDTYEIWLGRGYRGGLFVIDDQGPLRDSP